ncbi:sugar transferase [Patescibacteria group bacterium]|nr:sugar transferase [Patescibacteria group bacterium]MBU4015407.1 sugar transferase [Patescibacteria group bacterium]MBU4072895.1 sugar transferase [Patescibacteria group bacterium]MBU4102551.1 sugar transferase [Patescibacteria group bacterium]MBU4125393.1 sugar transferase [Patescibacteria group bacterium]
MKRSELFFSFLLVPLDFAMITLAGVSAYYIRYAQFFQELRPVIFNLQFGGYIKIVLLIAALWLIIFAFSGLYNIKGSRRLAQEIFRVILACSTGLMLIVILIFVRRELFDSRFIVLAGWILSIIYISFSRSLIRLIQRALFKYGIGVHQVVLVGNSKTTDNLIYYFSSKKSSGYEVVKRFRDFSIETANELAEFLKTKEVDEIMQSDPNLSKPEILRLYDFADEHHLTFKYAADLLGAKVLKTEVREMAGIPIVEVKKTPLDGWGRIIKRIFDIILAVFLIIFFSPLMIIFALLIKLDSRGPVFYKNERVSKNGIFKLFKFRSMQAQHCVGKEYGDDSALKYERELIEKQNIKQGEPIYKIANDPRLTRMGKFIRRWSIDELPQFFNVLAGNMSLVGPRPHQPREVARYEHHHKKVMSIKPGITGLAQISGRSDLSFEDEVKLDTYYIENWSLFFDLSILLRTPLAVIKERKAE